MADCDLVIGAVLVPGAKAPKIITRSMLKQMEKGTVIVDVAVDQVGALKRVIFYTKINLYRRRDCALLYSQYTWSSAHYLYQCAKQCYLKIRSCIGQQRLEKACQDDPLLAKGLNIIDGKATHKAIADTFSLSLYENAV